MSRVTLPEPVEIAKFFKSARDRTRHIRVELSEHKGHQLVNVRYGKPVRMASTARPCRVLRSPFANSRHWPLHWSRRQSGPARWA